MNYWKIFKAYKNLRFIRNLRIKEELNLEDRVIFLDPVPPKEVLDYIKFAKVCILAIQNVCLNYYFYIPNKLFESVFAGLPVIVSQMKYMSDFVKENKFGEIVNIDSISDLSKSIDLFF